MNPQKIAKRKSDINLIHYLTSHFGTNKTILRVYLFTSMHVLNFVYWICVTCFSNKIGMNMWLEIIILRSPEKGVSWKFWLDPRFPRNSKLKWILSDCLSIGVTLNFTFIKGESLLIISCHTYLLTRKFDNLFQIIFALPCIFLFKVSRVSILLIDSPSKKRWHGNFGSILGFPITPSKSEI